MFRELAETCGIGDLNKVDCGCFSVVIASVSEKTVLFMCPQNKIKMKYLGSISECFLFTSGFIIKERKTVKYHLVSGIKQVDT